MSLPLSQCAIHTITNKPWSLAECCANYSAAGVGGIGVWRNAIEQIGLAEAARIVRGSGLKVPSLVRGGFFVASDFKARRLAIDDNKRCIDEAAAIGAQMVVLVVGAVPGISLIEARQQVTDGIARCIDHATANNVKLAIEPLHPMYAADRSCVNRMTEARLMCEALQSPIVGIACDVYHTWWDPDLADEIARAGRQNLLFGFHVCDWRVPTRDLMNDRAIMGEGAIDIPKIRHWMQAAGFDGMIEVEIFSEQHWGEDQKDFLRRVGVAFQSNV